MSRSTPPRVPKVGRKKNKRSRKGNGGDNLEPKVSKGRDLDAVGAEGLAEGAIVLEPQKQFNKAIVGIASTGVLVYSASVIVDTFVEQGMSHEEAVEYFEYNTLRSMDYVPQETRPIFIVSERES